ncbi:MAG: PhzF family phenazine biosynthesis protein [Shimia sp.]
MTSYITLDVFTGRRFGGNPLAVFPDATGLPEGDLQSIAREFNYSETTFVFPPQDPAHTAHVRIFTPTQEVPFAGHPLIGTAVALQERGRDMVFETGVGPIPIRAAEGRAEFITRVPFTEDARPDPAHVAEALALPLGAIVGHPVQGGVGLSFVLTELIDREALRRCAPNRDRFLENQTRYPSSLDFAVFAHIRNGTQIDARMFAPLDDIPEDPATGSACAALAAMLGDGSYTIRQGEDMGRPSLIHASRTGDAITIAGQAIPMMRGTLL